MKVGDSKSIYPEHGPDPHKDLEKCVGNFKQFLNEYQSATSKAGKDLAKDRMEKELSLMDVAAKSLRKEPRVQELKVSNDFKVFSQNPSADNAAVLEQDLDTLKESLKH